MVCYLEIASKQQHEVLLCFRFSRIEGIVGDLLPRIPSLLSQLRTASEGSVSSHKATKLQRLQTDKVSLAQTSHLSLP